MAAMELMYAGTLFYDVLYKKNLQTTFVTLETLYTLSILKIINIDPYLLKFENTAGVQKNSTTV